MSSSALSPTLKISEGGRERALGELDTAGSNLRRVVSTAATIVATLLLVALVWQVSHVMLVFFAAVLFAVLLDGMTRLVERVAHIPRAAALGLVFAAIAGVIVTFVWVVGPQLSTQISELGARIPEAVKHLASLLRDEAWSRMLLEKLLETQQIVPPAAGILGQFPGVFSTTVGALTNAAIIVVAGAYLAIEPNPYIHGALRLLPLPQRAYGREVLQALGRALSWWLIGRMVSMVAVGLLTVVGLWLIEMPLALALGLIAGLLSFVPYLGPILSAVPAILVALVHSPLQVVYVVIVYSTVQFLESNLITPVVQERAVSLPPAVLLIAQLAMGVLFGLLGVLLATPFAVVVIALIQMLYVRDMLGDRIRILGQHEHTPHDQG